MKREEIKLNTEPDLPTQVRAYREKHGLTFREFAERLGVCPATAFRVEQGRPLTIRVRAKIRSLLGEGHA